MYWNPWSQDPKIVQSAAITALGVDSSFLLGIPDHLEAHSQPQPAQFTQPFQSLLQSVSLNHYP